MTDNDYPWIDVWCEIMGSYPYYVRDEKERARALKAPQTTISVGSREGADVVTLEEITSLSTMSRIEAIAEKRGLEIPENVREAWAQVPGGRKP